MSRGQRDWDDYLPYVLFAYREVPQESTGFSPFELLYGRRVRGPLDVLKEAWTEEREDEVPVVTHVVEMRDRMQEMLEIAQDILRKSQLKQKANYGGQSRARCLEPGDKALVLSPTPQNRLKLGWVGPYKVVRRVGPVDYEIEMPGHRNERKVYHINMIKKWHPDGQREHRTTLLATKSTSESGAREVLSAPLLSPLLEDVPDIHLKQLQQLLADFPDLFSGIPGRTLLVEHDIDVGDSSPIRQRPYRVPYAQRQMVKEEIEKMLEAGVIRPSTSPWAFPVVLVGKKDGSVRFCVDFRKLNAVAKFDAYPMPCIDEVFEHIRPVTIISTLDLAKGYWQISLTPSSKEKTAFTTPFGLYEFHVMPFGLHSAPATFQWMMDHVLRGCEDYAGAYIDNVIVFSESWESHLSHLAEVFK